MAPSSPPEEIRSRYRGFASLDLAAVAGGLVRALAYWYWCRLTDRLGSGICLPPPIFSGATAWRTRRAGGGVFWTQHGPRMFLKGPATVARNLGVRYVAGAYFAPSLWLRERKRATLRARFSLNAIAILRKRLPLRVAAAASLPGVTQRTFRRWVRALGWPRVTNLSLRQRIVDPQTVRVGRRYSDKGSRMRGIRVKGEWWLAEQLPNSFALTEATPKKRRAALRRINRKLPPYDSRGRGQRLYSTGERRSPKPTTQLLTQRGKTRDGVQLWNSPAPPPPLNTDDRIEMLIRRDGRREQVR